ncbi:hypothetical protein DFJ63DRAFT_216616 [Scheffersomyces coipomensis]|uniref:uncharacterized protein n=1 Tax=Scheffersomyces coipomensis TaxID=1788519 RepID=UPI00315CBF2C
MVSVPHLLSRRYTKLGAAFVTILILLVFGLSFIYTAISPTNDYLASRITTASHRYNFNSKIEFSDSRWSKIYNYITGYKIPLDEDPASIMDKLQKLDSYDKVESFPIDSRLLHDVLGKANNKISDDKSIYKLKQLKIFTDPYQHIKDIPENFEFDLQDICPRIAHDYFFQISDQQFLDADFSLFNEALKDTPDYLNMIWKAEKKFKSKDIPNEHKWLRFAGSSVWLPQYECHYMVSRVLYTPTGIANKSFVSFLYVQLFDKHWNEIKGSTLTLPYEQNTIKNVINTDGSYTSTILKRTIAFRNVTYPSILPIPIDYKLKTPNDKYYFGPEDPRILTRKNPLGFDEPIIVFNMKSKNLDMKRVMHQYLPFSNKLDVLKKRSHPFANIEKNWTPFISKNREIDQGLELGNSKINFIYSIGPLEILSCEIDTGVCDFLQKSDKKDYDYIGPIRGGTQLVSLPFDELIPEHIRKTFDFPPNRQAYVGWARAHLSDCGCGESMYRPNLIILIEDYNPETKKFYYKLSDISDYFDFDALIPAWVTPKLDEDGKLIPQSVNDNKNLCDGRNVLIPNSIAYWDIHSIIKNGLLYNKVYFSHIPTDEHLNAVEASKQQQQQQESEQKQKQQQQQQEEKLQQQQKENAQEQKLEQQKEQQQQKQQEKKEQEQEEQKQHQVPVKREDVKKHPVTFNDYMGVTLSAADNDVSIIHIHGLLNYILTIPSIFNEKNIINADDKFRLRGYDLNNRCAIRASEEYCQRYGKANYSRLEADKAVKEKQVENKPTEDKPVEQQQEAQGKPLEDKPHHDPPKQNSPIDDTKKDIVKDKDA